MKVFVVTMDNSGYACQPSAPSVNRVFSSESSAKKYCTEQNSLYGDTDFYEYEEWTVID